MSLCPPLCRKSASAAFAVPEVIIKIKCVVEVEQKNLQEIFTDQRSGTKYAAAFEKKKEKKNELGKKDDKIFFSWSTFFSPCPPAFWTWQQCSEGRVQL